MRPRDEWEPRRACWPDLSRAFEVRQIMRKLNRRLARGNAKVVQERESRRC